MDEFASLQPHHTSGLQWQQPSGWSRRFELRSGDTQVGSLEFQSAFGSRAEGRIGEETWTLKRMGFFQTRVTVRRAGSDEDAAVYIPTWSRRRGLLTLADGTQYQLSSTSFWAAEWVWLDSREQVVMKFHNKGFLHHGADVEVGPDSRQSKDLGMLLLTGWYLLFLYQEDSSGAAVVAN